MHTPDPLRRGTAAMAGRNADSPLRSAPGLLCRRRYRHAVNSPRARRLYERKGPRLAAFGDGSSNGERCPDALYEMARTLGRVQRGE